MDSMWREHASLCLMLCVRDIQVSPRNLISIACSLRSVLANSFRVSCMMFSRKMLVSVDDVVLRFGLNPACSF